MIDINATRGYNVNNQSQLDYMMNQHQQQQLQQLQLQNYLNQQQGVAQPVVANSITELEEFLSQLPTDKKTAIETSQAYQNIKLKLFEKFFTFSISRTNDGQSFLNTPIGKRGSQELLDIAQKINLEYEDTSKNEFEQMKSIIQTQTSEIEQLKEKLANVGNNSNQSGSFDFSNASPPQPISVTPPPVTKATTKSRGGNS